MFDRSGALVLLAVAFAGGCSGAVSSAEDTEDQAAGITPAAAVPPASAIAPSTPGSSEPPNSSASVPVATPVATPATPMSASPQAMAAPQVPVAAPPAAAPQPMMPSANANPSANATTGSPSPGSAGASNGTTEFDAGAGTMQPDGKTVVFHIADGTGSKDWNSMDMPIRVRRGMTLHLIDDDTTKAHQLHTLGQPCSHGSRPIGMGYDCAIRDNATLGISNGAYDHNAAGGRGRIYIDVVE